MAEYTYHFDPSIDVEQEARRVHGLLHPLVPEPKQSLYSGVAVGGVRSFSEEPAGVVTTFKTYHPSDRNKDLLQVGTDTRKPGEIVITSPVLTEAQIKSTLETKR